MVLQFQCRAVRTGSREPELSGFYFIKLVPWMFKACRFMGVAIGG